MSKKRKQPEPTDSQPDSDSTGIRLSNSRRDVLKTAAVGTLGVFGLSGTAAATHQFHTEGPNKTTADGDIAVELASSTYESSNDDLVPFGIMWNIDQDCGSTAWHEVRNLTVDFRPWRSNPTDGSYHSHTPWDDESDQDTYPDAIDVLESIAWEFMPTSFSITEAGTFDDIHYKVYDASGGEGLKVTWGEHIRCPKHGGVDLAYYLDEYAHSEPGDYGYTINLTGDVFYVSNYGTGQVDDFSVYASIQTTYDG